MPARLTGQPWPPGAGSAASDGSASGFWARVQAGDPLPPAAETGEDLAGATRAAWRRDDLAVAFRRNRELVDAHGRFRRFTVSGEPYVAKVITLAHARRERDRAAVAAGLLADAADRYAVAVPALVPLDGARAALVLPDYGRTLAESVGRPDRRLAAVEPVDLARDLVERGVLWGGFAPRNICPAVDGRLILLDMEDALPAGPRPAVDELTLRFWAVNWALPGADPARLHEGFRSLLAEAGVVVRQRDPDGHELAVGQLCWADDRLAQEICGQATTEVWRALDPGAARAEASLTPGDVAHLLDDLLPARAAVSMLLTLAAIRRRAGEARYTDALYAIECLVTEALAAAGAARRIRPDTTVLAGLTTRLFALDLLS
jgi:hypothetical protein